MITTGGGYFISEPGSAPRRGVPPQSAIEPEGAQAFAARAVRPGSATAGAVSTAGAAPEASNAVPIERPAAASLFLDHRAVDPYALDRNGNAPRRALTPDELRRVAAEYDLIEDDLRGQPDGVALEAAEMDEMRRINPHLKIVRYLWTLSSNDVPLAGIEPGDNNHETWFLRDAKGDYVRAGDDGATWNGRVNYALDPANVNVRLALGAQVRVFRRMGYDGALLDDVLPYVAAPGTPHSRTVLQAHPINTATGAPYTDEEWRAAVLGMLAKVREVAGPGTFLAIDGMTGSDYFAARGDTVAAAADAVVLRSFAASRIGPVPAARWLDDVNAAEEIARNGRAVVMYAPGASADAPERQERIDRYAFATYLLTREGADAYYGQAAPEGVAPGGYALQPSYRMAALGNPAGRRHEIAGLHVRLYERGAVVVNADDTSHEVALPGRYHTPDGVAVAGRMAVAAHDAVILVGDGE